MCVSGVYNLPGGQAILVRKFRAGQAKRIRCRDIKQHASLLQRRQSQGSQETPHPDYQTSAPSSSVSMPHVLLGNNLKLTLLWHHFRSKRDREHSPAQPLIPFQHL